MKPLSLMDMKIQNSPEAFAGLLRDMGDIFWWEPGKFWVVTAYDLAKSILTSEDYTCDRSSFFVSRMPLMDLSLLTDFFSVVGKMMVMSDAPAHTKRRRVCYEGFTNQALLALQSTIVQTVAKQMALIKQKGNFEFVEDLAKIIPSTTLAELFAIPLDDRDDFYHWSNNMTQFFGGSSQYRNEDGIEVNQSAIRLRQFFTDLVASRRKNPKHDFLSMLLRHQQAFQLTDEEIISQAIMMLVAGQITTTDQMCNNLYTLLQDPVAQKTLWQNPELINNALDELNRLDPAVTFIFRVTKNATLIGGQKIRPGDVIFISTHAINRDPTVFDSPDQCNFNRIQNKQMSYGYGSHYCLGAKLARIEMSICFEALIETFPKLKLDHARMPNRKHHSLAFSGFESLPLVY